MCKAIEDMCNQSFLEGKENGIKENSREIAGRMLTEGKFSIEEVVKLTKLSLEEVKELQSGHGRIN